TRLRVVSYLSLFSAVASPPTDCYTLSLHDALPISLLSWKNSFKYPFTRSTAVLFLYKFFQAFEPRAGAVYLRKSFVIFILNTLRSEEHTSELQSRFDLVCGLLLEKNTMHTRLVTAR